MIKYFDFEEPIEKIDNLIDQIKKNNHDDKRIKKLESEKIDLLKKIYNNLDPWQKVQVSRHSERPHTKDYIEKIFEDITYLHGDKKYSDDNAIIGGLALLNNKSVMVFGTEKGNSMDTRIKHNFGMAKPEGYRKAQRLTMLAEKFNLPIISFIDTAGAFPGKDAEERGQSESIANSILVLLKAKTPTISIIIGEGGSGGAIGIGTSDKVLMLKNSIYSVISPEGCASILWRSTDFTQEAAKTLKLTSDDCLKYKIIDEIIDEVPGGAHRNVNEQSKIIKNIIEKNLDILAKIQINELVSLRKNKYLNITSDI